MRKTKRLRAFTGVASVALLASYLVPFADIPKTVTAKADDLPAPKYGKEYTIENILSDYQYFVQDDFTVGCHTVGALAVGGNAELPNEGFGQGAVTHSYFKHIAKSAQYDYATFYKNTEIYDSIKDDGTIYYNTIEEGMTQNDSLQIQGDYIDFAEAFRKVNEWSEEKKNSSSAWTVATNDLNGGKLTIDLKNLRSTEVIIPADVYNSLKKIEFVDEKNGTEEAPNYQNLSDSGLIFTFDGVNDAKLRFGSFPEGGASDGIMIEYNGKNISTTAFQNLQNVDAIEGGAQSNVGPGISLLWNFPDATDVDCTYLAGHVVAPKAHYKQTGRNAEGNVIAKSADGGVAEAHFYSYRSLLDLGCAYSIDLYKYVGDFEGDPLAGAILGLYPVNEGTVGSTPARRVKTGSENPNALKFNAGRYVVQEVTPPAGFQLDTEHKYYIEVAESDQGTATAVVGKENGYDVEQPNTPYTGTVTVTVYKDETFTDVKEPAVTLSPLAVAKNTYNIGGKDYAVEVEDGEEGPVVTKVFEVKADGTRTDVTAAEKDHFFATAVSIDNGEKNYIIARDGEVATANLHLSDLLETKFEFADKAAFTLTKVDAADQSQTLTGADFTMVDETYTEKKEGETTTYERRENPAAQGSIAGFTWDSENFQCSFDTNIIRSISKNGDNYGHIYRITETQAPKGYLNSSNDILIAAARIGSGFGSRKVYFMTEVRKGGRLGQGERGAEDLRREHHRQAGQRLDTARYQQGCGQKLLCRR